MHMNSRWSHTQGKVWEGSEHRSFCPCGVGMHHPPGTDVVTHLEALQTPYCREFMEASSRSHDQLLTSFLAPVSSQDPDSPHQNKTYSQYSHDLGIYKGFRSPVSGTRVKDQYIYIFFFYDLTPNISVCQLKTGRKPRLLHLFPFPHQLPKFNVFFPTVNTNNYKRG